MAFAGVELITAKIILDGMVTEKVSTFKYLGCEILGITEMWRINLICSASFVGCKGYIR
jgi:hypothetical protein